MSIGFKNSTFFLFIEKIFIVIFWPMGEYNDQIN